MKKLISLLTAIIITAGCLAFFTSCNKKNADMEKAPQSSVNIIENGKSVYSVVYPASGSKLAITAANKIIDGISALTGVTLPSVSDSEAAAKPDGKYIIVGNSSLDETAKVKATLKSDTNSYVVEQTESGNIVIVSNKEEQILVAAEYYVSNLLTANYDATTTTLNFEGCYFDGVENLPLGFQMEDLIDTKIVYATNLPDYQAVAETLHNKIRDVYNLDVPVYSDEEKGEASREILIGETNREISKEYYSNSGYIMEYKVFAYRGSLQIACGGSFTARKAAEYICSNLLTSSNASKVLGQGEYASKSLIGSNIAVTSGTDARIMTLNIMPYTLGEAEYANILPVSERAEIVAGMLINVTPDVIGLQEACFEWQEQLPHYIEVLGTKYNLGYSLVFSSHNERNNYTPIIYRADKFDAIEYKYQHYDYHTSSANSNGIYVRGAAQIVLQNINDSSQKFIVINSHWDHGGQTTTAHPQYMNECASSEAAIVNAYKEKYPGVRIFCTGDFNSHRYNNVFFNQFCDEINGTVASEAASAAGTLLVAGGYHAGSAAKIYENGTRDDCSPAKGTFIDHVVFTCSDSSMKTSVLSHNTIYRTEGYNHIISDHCPVYADFDMF